MIIELNCRFIKEVDSKQINKIKEELDIQKLIKGDNFDYDKEKERLLKQDEKYGYNPICFELKDVFLFTPVDSEHTCIKFYNNTTFTMKVKYDDFKNIYQSLQGTIINDFKNYIDGK